MKIQINDDVLKDANVNLEEVITLLLYHVNPEGPKQAIESLQDKGLLMNGELALPPKSGYRITNKGARTLYTVSLDSDDDKGKVTEAERLKSLAKKLKEIYPKGKNAGGYYWAEGVSIIARRLKDFFRFFDVEYTDEEIINATKRYVEHNKTNTYMKTLRYFIFRRRNRYGEQECSSDLITYIENESEKEYVKEDWTSKLS